MGVGEGLSGTEGVVSTFFLIRYQTAIASSRDNNLARQFSNVSLVHRMETNIERQFFEVRPFIFAVQQNLPDALTKRLPREVVLNSPPMAIKIRPSQAEQIAKNVRLRLKISTCNVICNLVLLVTMARLRLGLS